MCLHIIKPLCTCFIYIIMSKTNLKNDNGSLDVLYSISFPNKKISN